MSNVVFAFGVIVLAELIKGPDFLASLPIDDGRFLWIVAASGTRYPGRFFFEEPRAQTILNARLAKSDGNYHELL